MILHIEPVADILALAVDRERLVIQCVDEHQRNELLRELIRSVVVGASGNGDRETECSVVCQDEQICRCLRAGVGAGGVKRGILMEEEIRAVKRQIAVYLVGRDLVEPADAVLAAGIHQDRRSMDVGFKEDVRIHD